MQYGELLKNIRHTRRLTQEALAAACGISSATIYRLERGETPNRSTAIALFTAIEQLSRPPLTEDERTAYLRLTGLDKLVAAVRPAVDQIMPLRAFTASLPPDAARVYWAVADLMEQTGPAVLLQMLKAVASMAGVTLEPPVPGDAPSLSAAPQHRHPGPVRVVKPPVQRDGYVEQEIVEYGPAPEPAAEVRKETPKKKRRSS